MNVCSLVGNLTRDPELKTTGGGKSVCTFSLACNRRTKSADGRQEADFINIVVWEKTGEACARYLKKGSKCGVIGSIRTSTYEYEGAKRYKVEVIAREVEFYKGGSGKQENGSAQGRPAAQKQPEYNPEPMDEGYDGYTEIDDDELPF